MKSLLINLSKVQSNRNIQQQKIEISKIQHATVIM